LNRISAAKAHEYAEANKPKIAQTVRIGQTLGTGESAEGLSSQAFSVLADPTGNNRG